MKRNVLRKIAYLLVLICACSMFLGAGLLSLTAEITDSTPLLDLDKIVTVGPGNGDISTSSNRADKPTVIKPEKTTVRVYHERIFLNNVRCESLNDLEAKLKEKQGGKSVIYLVDDYAFFQKYLDVKKRLNENGYNVEESRTD